MALPDYAPAALTYAGAALGVYLVSDILVCKGLIRGGGRIHGGLISLIALIGQRFTVMLSRWWSRGEAPSWREDASGTLAHEAYYWLPVIPAWLVFVAIGAWVKAVRERAGVPEPPRAPGRRGRAGRRA